jgi:hypothetical protein
MKMPQASGAEPISDDIIAQLNALKAERQTPSPAIIEELELQKRLRNGDYPITSVVGAFQGALGAADTIGNWISGFFSAVPGSVAGVRGATDEAVRAYSETLMQTGSEELAAQAAAETKKNWQEYPEAFYEVADYTTWEPKTVKGKRFQEFTDEAYAKYVAVQWQEYIAEQVDQGYITPEEATYFRTSADALIMGALMKGGQIALRPFRRPKSGEPEVDINEVPLEGEVIPREAGRGIEAARGKTIEGTVDRPSIGEQKKLPAPPHPMERPPVGRTKRNPLDVEQLDKPETTQTPNEARAQRISEIEAEASARETRLRGGRQAGAIDPEVFAEGIAKMLRPGIRGTKLAADVSHALARQVAFKQVTDIRKLNSPTAKMLADRIMPLEDSAIPLAGGFHELISLKSGEYATRIENILEPLRAHVINANSVKTARLIALPKKTNDALFRSLDTGKVPESMAEAARALRAVLDDIARYQIEAGVRLEPRPNYIPHMWDASKIARLEYGRKKGGVFTKYLMEEEGLTFDAAQRVISLITHEEGFLDFVEDTGGRLQTGMDYPEWSRAHRVGGGPSKPTHLHQRKLKGEFDKAKDFLVTDLETVLTNYVRKAVEKAEYTRIAGPGEGKLNQLVRQIIEETQVSQETAGKLKTASPHEIAQQIYDVFDAMQHRFHQIKNPSVRKLSRGMAGYQVMNHLGLVALAQFPETMMPAARYRVATTTKGGKVPLPFKSYIKGVADAAQNAMSHASVAMTGKRVISKTEIRQHLERIGVIYPSALQSSATRMAGPTGVLTNRFIRSVMMEAITNLQRSVAMDTIQSMVRQNARYLAKGLAQGKKAKMYRQELIELGLEPEAVIDWYRAGMPKDHSISQRLDLAYVRGIDTTIIMPKAANTPRLYNDPRWQLPLLFTRFFTVYGNTVLKNLGKKLASGEVTNTRKLASIGAILAAIGIAYYTQFLREDIGGYQFRDEDDPMRYVDAVDRAGFLAMFTRLYPLIAGEYKYAIGDKWLINLIGGPVGTDMAKGIDAFKSGDTERMARYMAKMTPVANITPKTEDALAERYEELIDEYFAEILD